MSEQHVMDSVNRDAYDSALATEAYDREGDLSIAERVILKQVRARVLGKRILDIGVGGGRTTRFLLELSRKYTAIDYSEQLVNLVKTKFGLNSVYCCDARDMGRFPDESFDFILFSFNGLDYVPHNGRLTALNEIHRVLGYGGMYLFSSHNRNQSRQALPPTERSSRGSLTKSVKSTLKSMLLMPRHWRMRRYEVETAEYAIRNDSGLRYSLLTYYITIRSQIAQLESLGFSVEGIFDARGHAAESDDRSPWIHYLVSK
jgi:ubiquinone/menaquinone biosynthesis C-methylase UbiE